MSDPSDPGDEPQRRDLTTAARAAVARNAADIAEADAIIAADPGPGAAVVALARQSRNQARQLTTLIRLVLWLGRKTDSGF